MSYFFAKAASAATTPTVVSATIDTAGTQLTVVFSQACSIGAGGSGGMVVTPSGGAATITYVSGDGTSTWVFSVSRTILSSETATRTYTQPGNGIEGTSGGLDLASFTTQSVTNNSTATAGSYLINEGFEGTGVPAGWATILGAPNYGYTTTALAGSKSLLISPGDLVVSSFASQTSIDAYFMIRLSDVSTTQELFTLCNEDGSSAGIRIGVSGSALYVEDNTGAHNVALSSAGISVDTTYHIFASYVQGSGANAMLTLAFSTDGSRPTSGDHFASITNGDSTTAIVASTHAVGGGTQILDHVLIKSTAGSIPSNP